MKTIFIFLTCMLIAAFANAQSSTEVNVIPPTFKSNNHSDFTEFISKYIDYPEESAKCGKQGTVVVKFKVDESGKIRDVNAVNLVCPKLYSAVTKALEKTSGKWSPGLINGIPTIMEEEISVVFKLHPSYDFVEMAKEYQRLGNKFLFDKRNPKKALKFFDKGITLLPDQESILAMRSLCLFETGNTEDAEIDWQRIAFIQKKTGTTINDMEFTYNPTELKGFDDMVKALSR